MAHRDLSSLRLEGFVGEGLVMDAFKLWFCLRKPQENLVLLFFFKKKLGLTKRPFKKSRFWVKKMPAQSNRVLGRFFRANQAFLTWHAVFLGFLTLLKGLQRLQFQKVHSAFWKPS